MAPRWAGICLFFMKKGDKNVNSRGTPTFYRHQGDFHDWWLWGHVFQHPQFVSPFSVFFFFSFFRLSTREIHMQTITPRPTSHMREGWKWAAGDCVSTPCLLLSTPVSNSVSDGNKGRMYTCWSVSTFVTAPTALALLWATFRDGGEQLPLPSLFSLGWQALVCCSHSLDGSAQGKHTFFSPSPQRHGLLNHARLHLL